MTLDLFYAEKYRTFHLDDSFATVRNRFLQSLGGGRRRLNPLVDQSWTARAACAEQDPDDLFVRGAAQRQAREVCFACPVRLECLVDALDNRIQFGVWGGLTERERRALLRRSPSVESWRDTLAEMNRDEINELIYQRWPVGSGARRTKA